MFLLLATCLITFILIYYFYKYQTFWQYIDSFPGPKTLPIIGNVRDFGLNPVDNHVNLTQMVKDYGNIFRVWIGIIPIIVLTGAKDVEKILASNTIITKSIIYDLFYDWLGDGLLTSTGTKWFKHRKIITPSFHFKILNEFYETIRKNSRKFVDKLEIKAKTGEIFDIQNMLHYCTLDVICETAMGTEINAMDNHDSEIVMAFQDMCYVVLRRSFNPLKFYPITYRFSQEYQMEKKALKILKTFTFDIIEKRREYLQKDSQKMNGSHNTEETHQINGNGLKMDTNGHIEEKNKIECYGRIKHAFLDTLLMATIDDRPLTIKEIYDEVATFMFEGHDTTTSSLTFSMHLLSRHQEVQRKAYDEQVLLFGSKDLHKIDPSYQDVQEMKYLELVIKESLRMYPSVPIILRRVTEPLYLDGKLIPVGTEIAIHIFAMGYSEQNYKNPYKFDPERFLDRNETNPFEYVPFSAGPRNCIGQKFAMLEMKSLLSHIIRNFEILPATDDLLDNNGCEYLGSNKYDPILSSLVTLKSDNGVYIRLRKRSIL
ncbi:cytochrome P450 4e2-like [Condylostylus longicornis]|uniref:cytochrome P450 4e2-like n=1 Tax=Condylostylus longicornis TaxID=2530218 RepID=UPI00244E36C7|nr:cytochrome P450 4e2-like [Condylostylus longicornis]